MFSKRAWHIDGRKAAGKRVYSTRPLRKEYVLTAAGRDLMPVPLMIEVCKQQNCGEYLTRYTYNETGIEIRPIRVDAVKGAELESRPIHTI